LPGAKFTLRPSLVFSYIGIVTTRHSSSGRQPNFAAFSRGRHLYSAGRPSRWALVHILVIRLNLAIDGFTFERQLICFMLLFQSTDLYNLDKLCAVFFKIINTQYGYRPASDCSYRPNKRVQLSMLSRDRMTE